MPKLPNLLPKITINLIPQDPFVESIFGRFLVWALSIGRYIVILTELVVILSFLSRFKLDRDLTDVNEAIATQKAIISQYRATEKSFLSAQSRIDFIRKRTQDTRINSDLDFIGQNIPTDVKLTQLNIQQYSWYFNASSKTVQGMKATVDQIMRANPQSEVSLGKVKLNSQEGVINFDVKVDRKPSTPQKSSSTKTETSSGIDSGGM